MPSAPFAVVSAFERWWFRVLSGNTSNDDINTRRTTRAQNNINLLVHCGIVRCVALRHYILNVGPMCLCVNLLTHTDSSNHYRIDDQNDRLETRGCAWGDFLGRRMRCSWWTVGSTCLLWSWRVKTALYCRLHTTQGQKNTRISYKLWKILQCWLHAT